MRITAPDDGLIKTHDDAAAFFRYAALGATVVFDPLKRAKRHATLGASREFTLVMDAAPSHTVNARDVYCLPFRADNMTRRIRELLSAACASLEPLVVGGHSTQAKD